MLLSTPGVRGVASEGCRHARFLLRVSCVRRGQVSLDSLWTLQKLREDGGDKPGAEASSVFDRDSQRALTLGLGLHYASLTENQRAQIARRYIHQAPSAVQRAEDESRARDPASTTAAVSNESVRRPPSSTVVPGADDGIGSGDVLLSPPLNRPPPPPPGHFPLSPLEVVDVSPAEVDGGEGAPLPGTERPTASSPRSAQLDRLSLSQVDRDVLDCLPSEMRDEVLRAIASHAGGSGDGGGSGGGDGDGMDVVNRADRLDGDHRTHAEEGPVHDPGAGVVEENGLIDVCSPSLPSPPPLSSRRRDGGDRGVFEVESAGALRGALRAWVGGTVRSPSQWHLELLYR